MRRASWKALLLVILALAPARAGAVEVDRRYERHVHRRAGSPAGSALAQLAQLLGGCDRKAPFARSHALLIGVGRYRHLPALDSPARDVARLRDYLLTQGGFDEVVVLQDEAATPQAIGYFMEDYFPSLFDDPGEAGRFLFYFSGHGTTRKLPGGDLRGYLRLANNREGIWSDAIGMNEIAEWAANVRAARHSLFLIDTCVSGLAGFEHKGKYETDQSACDLIDLPGSLLLTAGQAAERALGGRRWSGSLFTEAFLTGLLEGSGDANGDGLITTLELFSYVRAVVSRESNGTQHPGLKDLAPPGRRGGELFFLRARPVRLPPSPPSGKVEVKEEEAAVPPPPLPSQPADDPSGPAAPSGKESRSEQQRKDWAEARHRLESKKKNDLELAFALSRALADALPADREAQQLAAEAAYRLARFEDSVFYFRRGGALTDEQTELLFYFGVALYESGRQTEAAGYLRRALPNLEITPYVEAYRRKILGTSQPPAELSWLGIEYRDLTPELRREHDLPSNAQGVLITGVARQGPMFGQEVRPGQVIEEVNGEPVGSVDEFERAMIGKKPRSYVRLYIRSSSAAGKAGHFFAVVQVPLAGN